MTIKDFKKLLSNYDDNLSIDAVVEYMEQCNCEEYCYCSSSDHDMSIYGIEKVTQYNKKTKKQDVVGVRIRIGS